MSPGQAATIRRRHRPVEYGQGLAWYRCVQGCGDWPCDAYLSADREHPAMVVPSPERSRWVGPLALVARWVR